ncbi:hypothetical protein [Streptomyces sp. NPDC048155]|uniref:hypothetical protein n=1 Tax=Streptomyces sp. NPDC048155 TaxID=3154818 RepID=UPI0033C2D87B
MWPSTTIRLGLGGRHRALGDAVAARELLLSLREPPPPAAAFGLPQPGRGLVTAMCAFRGLLVLG